MKGYEKDTKRKKSLSHMIQRARTIEELAQLLS